MEKKKFRQDKESFQAPLLPCLTQTFYLVLSLKSIILYMDFVFLNLQIKLVEYLKEAVIIDGLILSIGLNLKVLSKFGIIILST